MILGYIRIWISVFGRHGFDSSANSEIVCYKKKFAEIGICYSTTSVVHIDHIRAIIRRNNNKWRFN